MSDTQNIITDSVSSIDIQDSQNAAEGKVSSSDSQNDAAQTKPTFEPDWDAFAPADPHQNDDLAAIDMKALKKSNKHFMARMYRSLVIWTTCFFFAIFVPRRFQYGFLWPMFLRLYRWGAMIRPHYIGKNINNYKGVIFASNHKCFADAQIIMSVLKNPFCLLYRQGAFNNLFFKAMSARIGLIPISFANIASAESAFKRVKKRLAQKVSMIFFPEGRHVADRHIDKFQKGIAYLARETNAQIVPVAIYGIDDRVRFSGDIHDRDVYVLDGEPMCYSDYENDTAFIEELHRRVESLYMQMHEKYGLVSY